jgi:hypothetical protein
MWAPCGDGQADANQGGRGCIRGDTDFREGALGEDTAQDVSTCTQRGSSDGGSALIRFEGANNTYMSRQVFPQAPSPTMTSFRRISAMASDVVGVVGGWCSGWRRALAVMGRVQVGSWRWEGVRLKMERWCGCDRSSSLWVSQAAERRVH